MFSFRELAPDTAPMNLASVVELSISISEGLEIMMVILLRSRNASMLGALRKADTFFLCFFFYPTCRVADDFFLVKPINMFILKIGLSHPLAG